jgi:hypothetical protein
VARYAIVETAFGLSVKSGSLCTDETSQFKIKHIHTS